MMACVHRAMCSGGNGEMLLDLPVVMMLHLTTAGDDGWKMRGIQDAG